MSDGIQKIFSVQLTHIPKRTLGIHFRGTDHFHTDRIELSNYISAAETEFKSRNFDNIFIATDEDGVVEKIKDFFSQKYGFKNIIFNDTLKSSGRVRASLRKKGR